MNSAGSGPGVALAGRDMTRKAALLAVAINASPITGRRHMRATQCQRYPGRNGTLLKITRRSIRSGWR
jgi:hypothetical protein